MSSTVHEALRSMVQTNPTATAGHTAAIGGVVMSIAHWLSPTLTVFATFMAIVWYGLTIYEMQTTQRILHKLIASSAIASFLKRAFRRGKDLPPSMK